jgi:hypothetical protein
MRDLKIYILIGSIILGLYLLAEYNKPKPVDWRETFYRKDKIPFGSSIFFDRLNDFFPDAKVTPIRSSPYAYLQEETVEKGCYILQANTVDLDEYDFRNLERYMQKGNDVFISAYYLGDFIEDSLKTKINSILKLKSKRRTPIHFVNPSLNPSKWYQFDKGIGDQYFSKFDTARAIILGTNNNGKANFLRYSFGKGNLYIIASPYFFTNYNLLKPRGAEYAAKALSYLKSADEVIWDEYSSQGGEETDTPMIVFLKNPKLRWAYFTALFGLILFVLYEIKRRQRIIPVISAPENSTLEFVRVVGQVYYQQRDNGNIAHKKITYLLEEVRSRYNIKTTTIDQDFMSLLEKKAGVSKAVIEELVSQINLVKKYKHVSDKQLIELNNTIEQFQQQSK